MDKYDHQKIEKKWQDYWAKNKLYSPRLDKAKKPFYNLMMFPYPSAEGLHVGNMYAFVHSDTYGRFMRLKGFDVFEPIGLDGFGIHSENYAIKQGEHILDVSKRTEKHFYEQLKMIGNQYDWTRTLETYKPEYYKWTQWIFVQMFKKGLAYRGESYVNWCPSCKTVLSDEQVISDRCERCDSIVEKKLMKQWFFKITDYAERLLKNLDWISWSERTKTAQRNWIGKSEGVQFCMHVILSPTCLRRQEGEESRGTSSEHGILHSAGAPFRMTDKFKDDNLFIEVFTTRLDTIFGCTYCVLAPEHKLIQELKPEIENCREVEKYVAQAQKKSELERTSGWEKVPPRSGEDARNSNSAEGGENFGKKTGIELKGIKAINPFNNQEIPIFVADYVLGHYGTGAVMAVPAHDKRDFEFAKKFNIPILPVILPQREYIDKDARSYYEKRTNLHRDVLLELAKRAQRAGKKMMIGGGWAVSIQLEQEHREYEDLDLFILENDLGWWQEQLRELRFIIGNLFPEGKSSKYYFQATQQDLHVDISAIRIDKNGKIVWLEGLNPEKSETTFKDFFEKKQFRGLSLWVENKNELYKSKKIFAYEKEGLRWKEKSDFLMVGFEPYTDNGILINSGEYNGLKSEEARKKMAEWLKKNGLGGKKVHYKLRDWCVSRQRYWGPPIPMIYCEKCARKPKIFYVHGIGGSSKENWVPWFKEEIEKRGYELVAPDLPNPDNPELKEWLRVLGKLGLSKEEKVFIVAHSMGAPTACQFIEKSGLKIEKLILVAPTGGNQGEKNWSNLKAAGLNEDGVRRIKDFNSVKQNWNKINKLTKETVIYFSDNDLYIPLSVQENYQLLKSRIRIFKGKGHFNQLAGVMNLPEILEEFPIALNSGWQPVAEKDLPVILPKTKDYLPRADGLSPLARNEKFWKTTCPKCGGLARRETDVSDTFLDSSWYFFRYPSVGAKNSKLEILNWKLEIPWNQQITRRWLPVNMYIGGHEHAVLHLLYSRFITMFFRDLGLIDFEEPYKRFFAHGLLIREGAKISKSKGNIVNPDEYIKKYGADAVRMYLMFLGDVRLGGDWRDAGMAGMFRFIGRIWRLKLKIKNKKEKTQIKNEKIDKLLHKTIKKVRDDLENLKFNTAISALMIFVNQLEKEEKISLIPYSKFLILLSPFAPHITEELWSQLGHKKSIFIEKWPEYDPKLVKEETIELVIQVNGKLRDRISVPADISEQDARSAALSSEKIKKFLAGQEPKKVIFVKGKLVNIVV